MDAVLHCMLYQSLVALRECTISQTHYVQGLCRLEFFTVQLTYPAIDWVGSCQYTAPSIELCMDPSLRDGDPPLLHDLVDGSAVHVTHLGKG